MKTVIMADVNRERELFLREAREALDRQRGGPLDRGDGETILRSLDGLLDDIRDGWLVFVRKYG